MEFLSLQNWLRCSPNARSTVLFGLTSNEGLETSWEHSWPWPPWVTVLVLIALAGITIGIYLRERGRAGGAARGTLIVIRLSLIGLLFFMLHGWTQQQHRTDLPELAIAIDDSLSMSTLDGTADGATSASPRDRNSNVGERRGLARFDAARNLLIDRDTGLLSELLPRYRVRWYLTGETTRPIESADPQELATQLRSVVPEQSASRLGRGILDILQQQRGRPTAAIVLLTDGITTDGPLLTDAATQARRRQIPLYFIGLGSSRAPIDVALSDLMVDELAFINDLVSVDARLTATGCAGRELLVRLRRVDTNAVLAEQRLTIKRGEESTPIRLAFRPKEEGRIELALSVEPIAEEVNLANNRLTRTIQVTEQTLRVLMVQASPNYEFRFLKSLLSRQRKLGGDRQQAIDLTTVLQEADPEYASQDESAQRVFPVTLDELAQYDVVIFGDVNPSLLGNSALTHLNQFVSQRGGGLIVVSGPRFTPLAYRDTPLAELLPIRLDSATQPDESRLLSEPFSPRLTPLGQSSPHLQLIDAADRLGAHWQQLPGWYWCLEALETRPGVQVLAEHPTRSAAGGQAFPLITLQFLGAGKIVFHATDDVWRWSRDPQAELSYARYWMQTLRYLSRSKLTQGNRAIVISTDREEYQHGDEVRFHVRFLDERLAPPGDGEVTVVVEREDGGRRSVSLRREATDRGRFTGTMTQAVDGVYRVWLAAPTVDNPPKGVQFTIRAPPGEQARLAADTAELAAAARLSSGRSYGLSDARRLLSDLPPGRPVRIESLPPTPLWNWWPFAALFVVLLTAEWLLRRRWGMI